MQLFIQNGHSIRKMIVDLEVNRLFPFFFRFPLDEVMPFVSYTFSHTLFALLSFPCLCSLLDLTMDLY